MKRARFSIPDGRTMTLTVPSTSDPDPWAEKWAASIAQKFGLSVRDVSWSIYAPEFDEVHEASR